MARRKKRYDDDDGRVIASMSDIERPGRSSLHYSDQLKTSAADEAESAQKPDQPPFTPQERRLYALAALKAALLIGLAFLGGLGLVIWLITLL